MEPLNRLVLEYPVYGMDTLENDVLAVAGGGGQMKSGIPNACVRFMNSLMHVSARAHEAAECFSVAFLRN